MTAAQPSSHGRERAATQSLPRCSTAGGQPGSQGVSGWARASVEGKVQPSSQACHCRQLRNLQACICCNGRRRLSIIKQRQCVTTSGVDRARSSAARTQPLLSATARSPQVGHNNHAPWCWYPPQLASPCLQQPQQPPARGDWHACAVCATSTPPAQEAAAKGRATATNWTTVPTYKHA